MQEFRLNFPRRIHVAIMRKSWGLTRKILTGEKTIESRWYKNKYKPWGQVDAGDTVYFKDSGEPVTVKATIAKVLQFDNLDPNKVGNLLKKYSKPDGLGVDSGSFDKYFEMFKDKNYCLIIFLKDVKEIKPFRINKSGFGIMASWLIVDDIEKIKIKD